MLHTNLKGEINWKDSYQFWEPAQKVKYQNWKDGDDKIVLRYLGIGMKKYDNLLGTFAKVDKFRVYH